MQDPDVIIRSRLLLASPHPLKIDPIPVEDSSSSMELFVDSFHNNSGPLVIEKVCLDAEGEWMVKNHNHLAMGKIFLK